MKAVSMQAEAMKAESIKTRLTSAGLFLFAVTVRAFSLRWVIQPDGIHLRGNDSFYHLRRVAYNVANFPSTLDFDRYINFPSGARPIWTPIMDWLLAAIVWPFAGEITELDPAALHALEAIIIWVPPVLGGLTVVLVYSMARKRFGAAVATCAGVILSLLPAHSWYSQLGFVDHHVLVAMMTWVALTASMALLERGSTENELAQRWAELGVGLAFAAAILVWPGSVYHVVLLEIGFLTYLLSRAEKTDAIRFSIRFAVLNAVALVVILPFTIDSKWDQWAPFSPVVLSEFQPWLFALLSAFGWLCAALFKQTDLDRGQRGFAGISLGVVLLIGSLAIIPDLGVGAAESIRWLLRTEAFQSQVVESIPLLVKDGRFSLDWAVRYLSAFVLVFPLALGVAAFTAWRSPRHRASLLLLVWFSLGLFAATLAQRRFANSFALPMALLIAWAGHSIDRAAESRLTGRPRASALAKVTLYVLAFAMLTPVALFYQRAVNFELARLRGESASVPATVQRHDRMMEVAYFLRDHTPPTRGWLDASVEPEYAVLAYWSIGHRIEYLARRPTVTNAFGDDIGKENFRAANLFFLLPEPEAVDILRQHRVRYVVASRDLPAHMRDAGPESMFRSLSVRDGSARWGKSRDIPLYPALEHHRLLFESGRGPVTRRDASPVFKVFEHVRGAVLSGRSRPGVAVRATLELRSNRGRRIVFSTAARASADGEYAIRVPYSTNGYPGSFEVQGLYRLECGDDLIEVSVDEIDVQEGRTIGSQDLCLDSQPGA